MNWKIIESSNEIEVVLQAKTENFVAFGFKPNDLDRSCQAFPYLSEAAHDAESEAESEDMDTLLGYFAHEE